MKKLAVLAIAGLMSVTASATNWVSVTDNDRDILYVDVDSISNSGRYKTAFVRLNMKQYDEIVSEGYDSVISLMQFDCRSNPRKYRPLSGRAQIGNRTVFSTNPNYSTSWDEAYPDSAGRDMTDLVCSFKK